MARLAALLLLGACVAVPSVRRFNPQTMRAPMREDACEITQPRFTRSASMRDRREMTVSYVINAEGQADAVQLQSFEAPRPLFESLRSWLMSCRFVPAQSLYDGQPLTVRISEVFEYPGR